MGEIVKLAAGEAWKRAASVKQGETFDFVLRWRLAQLPLSYADLSLYTIRCSIRPKDSHESVEPSATLTLGSGLTLSDYTVDAETFDNAELLVRFLPAQTLSLSAGKLYKGDLRLELISDPTQDVRFPLSQFEFLVKGAQTNGS